MNKEILLNTAIGMRSFRKPQEDGSLSTADAIDLDGKRDVILDFSRETLGQENLQNARIITTGDLPLVGRLIFESSKLSVVYADTQAAKVSWATMVNAFSKSASPEITSCVLVSPSLASIHKEVAIEQVTRLVSLFNLWEKAQPGKLAFAGSLVLGEHDPDTAKAAVEGTEDLALKNLWKVFPTNAFSLFRPNSLFSNITDNGKLGTVEVEGGTEKVGGNEDFYFAFGEMLKGRDCVVLIDPAMPGERDAHLETVGKKVQRREKVYEIYAKTLLDQHFKDNQIYTIDGKGFDDLSYTEQETARDGYLLPLDTNTLAPEKLEKIIEEVLDKHLFFARLDDNGDLDIVLTRRQRSLIPQF